MRVALDATPLSLSTGGLTRYAGELSRALARAYPTDDFVLFSDRGFPLPEPCRENLRVGAQPRNAFERRWWLCGIQSAMRHERSELFHGTNFAVPYLPLQPSVVTVHDLSPWINPEWHHAADRVRRRTVPLLGLGIATMIITPTQAVRAGVIERFRVAAARVVAVPHAASDIFHPAAAPAARPYFLYVGALEPRKNLEGLIGAWRELRRCHDADLVLAGRKRADFRELPAEPGLRVEGEVSDTDLAQLYSGALALVYPSHYEGFGLPVLEAMQCGACVLISKDAALCEVAGQAGVSLDGAQGWVEAMCAAASNPEWRNERRAKSLARAREFSWARTAQLTYDVYEEALNRF